MEVVVDTKWKRLGPAHRDRAMGVARSDVYQLMAYAQLYRCERLILLSPSHAGLKDLVTVHHRIAEAGGPVRQTVATIDISSHAAATMSLTRLLEGALPAGDTPQVTIESRKSADLSPTPMVM